MISSSRWELREFGNKLYKFLGSRVFFCSLSLGESGNRGNFTGKLEILPRFAFIKIEVV